MKIKLILFIIILLIAGYSGYRYIYQDHRNIQEEKASFEVQAIELKKEFSVELTKAESKYINKTILVSGHISEIEEKTLILNEAVYCQFSTALPNNLKVNQSVTIKGRFIGYDDLLEYINLDQCAIKN